MVSISVKTGGDGSTGCSVVIIEVLINSVSRENFVVEGVLEGIEELLEVMLGAVELDLKAMEEVIEEFDVVGGNIVVEVRTLAATFSVGGLTVNTGALSDCSSE